VPALSRDERETEARDDLDINLKGGDEEETR